RGDLEQTGPHADTTYVFRLFDDFGITKDVQESILLGCLDIRMARWREMEGDDRQRFEQSYVPEMAFKYLAGLGTERSTQRLCDLLVRFVGLGEYCERGWRDRDERPDVHDWIYDIASALDAFLDRLSKPTLAANAQRQQAALSTLDEKADE